MRKSDNYLANLLRKFSKVVDYFQPSSLVIGLGLSFSIVAR